MSIVDLRSKGAFWSVPSAIAVVISALGCLVLLGWLFDIAVIKSVIPGLTAMNPMTAVCFILASVTLWLFYRGEAPWLSRIFSVSILVIALLKLIDLLFGMNIGIDQLLFSEKLMSSTMPNRMAPNTVISFLLLGSALSLTTTPSLRLVKLTQIFTLLTMLIAFLALIGYVYNVGPFYGVLTYIPMALNTAVIFLVICLGVLSVQPTSGLMKVWRSATTGGVVARRLLPAAILIPSLAGGLVLLGQRSELYGAEFGSALFATASVILLVGMIGWTATLMYRADIERKKIEEALRESEARYRGLFENSSDTILIGDEQGCYLDCNPEAERLTGYSRDELLTLCSADLTTANFSQNGQSLFEAFRSNSHIFGESIIARKDGSEVPVEFAAVSIAPGMYQSILHDIAARKEIEDSLRNALQQARDLNEMKSRFVSMVSHDFRTPLAVIQSSTDLLLHYSDRMDSAKQQKQLEKVQLQVTHLVEMLNDILVLGKAESVGVEFNPELVDLREFCAKLVSEIQPATPTHQIEFTYSGNHPRASIDPKLMRQAITNLLSNAVKYSPGRDQVTLNLAYDQSEIEVSVRDYGIGIPKEDQAHLFQLFQRARNVGDISGTGLGLPIVKQAVEAHGGTISVESRENVGTTFVIHLPQKTA